MKQSTKKFIATWYINVGPIPSKDIPAYMAATKAALNSPPLKDFLGVDNVVTYFIPIREGQTKLEVISLNT